MDVDKSREGEKIMSSMKVPSSPGCSVLNQGDKALLKDIGSPAPLGDAVPISICGPDSDDPDIPWRDAQDHVPVSAASFRCGLEHTHRRIRPNDPLLRQATLTLDPPAPLDSHLPSRGQDGSTGCRERHEAGAPRFSPCQGDTNQRPGVANSSQAIRLPTDGIARGASGQHA